MTHHSSVEGGECAYGRYTAERKRGPESVKQCQRDSEIRGQRINETEREREMEPIMFTVAMSQKRGKLGRRRRRRQERLGLCCAELSWGPLSLLWAPASKSSPEAESLQPQRPTHFSPRGSRCIRLLVEQVLPHQCHSQ